MTERESVVDTIIRSWWLIDIHGGRGVAELFAEDGTLAFGDAANRGRDEIDLVYAQRRARGERTSRHVATNLLVDPTEDGWRVTYIVTLYAADGAPVILDAAPIGVFDVVDELVADGDRMLLARRVLTQLFARPDGGLAVSFDRPAAQLEKERSNGS